MLFINELHIFVVSLVEYDPHHRLSCSHWTVDFGVNFIYRNWFAFPDECVEYVLAELLAFDDDFFGLRVELWVEDC